MIAGWYEEHVISLGHSLPTARHRQSVLSILKAALNRAYSEVVGRGGIVGDADRSAFVLAGAEITAIDPAAAARAADAVYAVRSIATLPLVSPAENQRRKVLQLLARRTFKAVAIALANKMARIAWALLASGGSYRAPRLAAAYEGTGQRKDEVKSVRSQTARVMI